MIDDCLSAVDAHVGQKIFKYFFKFRNVLKGVLKEKTVLFVTHAIHYTKDCDNIVVMKDGKIEESGNY